MGFDYKAAHEDGVPDDQIIEYLAHNRNFDLEGARADNHSDEEILSYLLSRDAASLGAPLPEQGGSRAGKQPGLLTQGNIDTRNRPRHENADGSISTVRSKSFEIDGREVLLPTIGEDGSELTDTQAVEQYRRTGRHLGKFDTPQNATTFAQRLHEDQARRISKPSPHTVPQEEPRPLSKAFDPYGGYYDPDRGMTRAPDDNGVLIGESIGRSLGEDFQMPSGSDWWNSLRGTLARQVQGFGLSRLEEMEDEILGRSWPIGRDGRPKYSRTPEELRALQDDPTLIAVRDEIARTRAAGQEITAEAQDIASRNQAFWPQVVMGATNSLAASAPALATTMATRNPMASLPMMYGPTAAGSYGEMREENVPRGLADKASTVEGIIEAVTEFPAMRPFAAEMSPLMRRLGETVAADIPGETIAGLGQSVTRKIAEASPNADTLDTVSEGLREGLAELPVTYGTVLMTAGAHAGLAKGIDATREATRDRTAETNADATRALALASAQDLLNRIRGPQGRLPFDGSETPPGPPPPPPPPPGGGPPGGGPFERTTNPTIDMGLLSSVVPQDPFAPELPMRDPTIQPELPVDTLPPPDTTGSPAPEAGGGNRTAPLPPSTQGTATPPTETPLSSAFQRPAASPATPAPNKPASTPAPQAKSADSTAQEPKAGGAATTAEKPFNPATETNPNRMVTLYRGEGGASEQNGNWWTTNKAKAEKYGKVRSIQLTAKQIAQNFATGHHGKGDEFVFGGSDRSLVDQKSAATPTDAASKVIPEGPADYGMEEESKEHIARGRSVKIDTAKGPVHLVNYQGQSASGISLIHAVNESGATIGALEYGTGEVDGERVQPNVGVDLMWRRHGIATAMYNLAELTGGKIPAIDAQGQDRTPDGKALREALEKRRASPPAKPAKAPPSGAPKQTTLFDEEGKPAEGAAQVVPEREPTGGDQVTPQPYGSGMSRPNDLRAAVASPIGAGVVATELSDNAMEGVADAVAAGKEVFVDSGAFSAFKAAMKAGKPNATKADFDKVFTKYNKLIEKVKARTTFAQRGLLTVVAPDVVGDQTASLALLRKHAEEVKQWMEDGFEVIVPFQRGPLPQSEVYKQVADILGGNDFVVGIPSNAAAMSNEEFSELLSQPYKPERIHILGAVNSPRVEERMKVIREQYKEQVPGVTTDANLIRSKTDELRGLKGEDRVRAIKDILERSATDTQKAMPPIEPKPKAEEPAAPPAQVEPAPAPAPPKAKGKPFKLPEPPPIKTKGAKRSSKVEAQLKKQTDEFHQLWAEHKQLTSQWKADDLPAPVADDVSKVGLGLQYLKSAETFRQYTNALTNLNHWLKEANNTVRDYKPPEPPTARTPDEEARAKTLDDLIGDPTTLRLRDGLDEARGTIENNDSDPQDISRRFWTETYPKLNAPTKEYVKDLMFKANLWMPKKGESLGDFGHRRTSSLPNDTHFLGVGDWKYVSFMQFADQYLAGKQELPAVRKHKRGKKEPSDQYEPLVPKGAPVRDQAPVEPMEGEVVPLPTTEEKFGEVIDDYAGLFEDPDVKVNATDHPDYTAFMSEKAAKKRVLLWERQAVAQAKENRRLNADKVIFSLFDLTLAWSQPYIDAGYTVIPLDLQTGNDILDLSTAYIHENFPDITEAYGILIAAPCTDFTLAGNRHIQTKDESGKTELSKELVFQAMRFVDYYKPKFWVLENPAYSYIEDAAGLPKARYEFQPYDFGDPYMKRTQLWGNFNTDLPVAPVYPREGSKMHSQYGGKSQATKNARSETPKGFAYAFFKANNVADASPHERLTAEFPDAAGAIEKALEAGFTEQQIRDTIESVYEADDAKEARADLRKLVKTGEPEGEPMQLPKPAERQQTKRAKFALAAEREVQAKLKAEREERLGRGKPAAEDVAEDDEVTTQDDDVGAKAAEEKPEKKERKPKVVAPTLPTDTKAFKDWFGKSKIVDFEGKPAVMYHGTPHNFDAFDRKAGRYKLHAESFNRLGSFFASNPEFANTFTSSQNGGAVVPVYLSIQKPLHLDSTDELINFWKKHAGGNERMTGGDPEKARAWLKEQGYDGIIMSAEDVDPGLFDKDTQGVYIIALEPNQIKSAVGNKGTFRKDRDSILEMREEDTEEAADTEGSSRFKRQDETIITPSTVRENLMNELGIDPTEFRLKGGKEQWEIASKAIKDKYGYAGVFKHPRQNWRNAVDHLLDAFESLQNMAAAMDQGNKIVSLNGRVSLYMREKPGKTKGYYRHQGGLSGEPNRTIAIFNQEDVYSHELGHAIDYDLMERAGGTDPGGLSRMIRTRENTSALPNTLQEAAADVMTALYYDSAEIAQLIKKAEHQLEKAGTDKRRKELQKRLDNLRSGAWRGRGSKTQFYKRAQSGPMKEYLTKPTELFARAFEAYMSWKIQYQNSLGLVKFLGATDAVYRDEADAWIARTYPQAEERQKIFSAFDNLLGQLARENLYDTKGNPGWAKSQLNIGLMDPVAQAKAEGTALTPEIVQAHNLTQAASETFVEDQMKLNDTLGKNWDQLMADLAAGKAGAADKFHAAMKAITSTPDGIFAFLERRYPNLPSLREIRNQLSDAAIHGRDKPVGVYRETQRQEASIRNRLEDRLKAVGIYSNMPAKWSSRMWDILHGVEKPANPEEKRQADQIRYELDYLWKLRDQTGEKIGYIDYEYLPRSFLRNISDDPRFHRDLLKLRVEEKKALIEKLNDQLAKAKTEEETKKLEAKIKAAEALNVLAMTAEQVGRMKGMKWGSPVYLGAMSEDSAKERVFGPLADKILKDYYVKDPFTLLAGYGGAAARGMVMRRRFGATPNTVFQGWLDQAALGLPSAYADILLNAMQTSLGVRRDGNTNLTRMVSAFANVQVASMLGRSVLPNISEPLNILKSSFNPLNTFGTLVKSMMPAIFLSKTTQERYAAADRFGRLSGVLVDAASSTTAMAQAMGEDVQGHGILARFSMRAYYFNMLSSLTATQEKVINRCAFELFYEAANIVRKGGKDAGMYRQWLREHGISDANAFAAYLKDNRQLDGISFENTIKEGSMAMTLANAIDHFGKTTIQKPTPSTKHIQAHNGLIGIIYRLTSWMTTNFINWAAYMKDKMMSGISGRYGADIVPLAERFSIKGEYAGQKLTAAQRLHGRVGGESLTMGQRVGSMMVPVAMSAASMYAAQACFLVARMMLTHHDEWEDRGEDFWERFSNPKTQLQILQYWGGLGWLMSTSIDTTEATRFNRGITGTLLGPFFGAQAQDAERMIKLGLDQYAVSQGDKLPSVAVRNNAAQAIYHQVSVLASVGLLSVLPLKNPASRLTGFLWSFFGTSPQATHEFADLVAGEKDAKLKKISERGTSAERSPARREIRQRERAKEKFDRAKESRDRQENRQ